MCLVLGAIAGHQRHRGRAAADHDDVLAGVIEIGGPELRVDDPPRKILRPGELGRVALGVIVIARAHEEEIAGHRDRPVGAFRRDRPARVVGRPRRRLDVVVVPDFLVDAVIRGGALEVAQDVRPVGDRLRLGPRPERVAERVHVGIRADAGIAKQVPRPAELRPPLKDRVAAVGAIRLQVIARADPRNSRAHHQDVDMFHAHHLSRRTGYSIGERKATYMSVSIASPPWRGGSGRMRPKGARVLLATHSPAASPRRGEQAVRSSSDTSRSRPIRRTSSSTTGCSGSWSAKSPAASR